MSLLSFAEAKAAAQERTPSQISDCVARLGYRLRLPNQQHAHFFVTHCGFGGKLSERNNACAVRVACISRNSQNSVRLYPPWQHLREQRGRVLPSGEGGAPYIAVAMRDQLFKYDPREQRSPGRTTESLHSPKRIRLPPDL